MKNEQQQQAKHLYFQTDLNKSQIAEALGVNRRTVMLWVQQGNWERLKMAAQHLPSMVVEKCYYMLNHYLDNLLSANSTISTFGPKEAAAINSMASSIKKISSRSAVNESMEMFSFFLEDVKRKDPDMADAIRPLIESYIAKRSKTNIADFLPTGFTEEGFINYSEDELKEQWLDAEEQAKMEAEGVFVNPLNESSSVVIPSEGAQKPEAKQQNTPPPTQQPYRPINRSGVRLETDHLPKSVEKQLTEYLRKENKSKVAA